MYSISFFIIVTFSIKVLLQTRFFFTTATFWKKLIFQKSNIPRHLFFRKATFSRPNFPQQLFCQKSHCFTTFFFRTGTLSQLRFLSIATLPIYQLANESARYQVRTVKVREFFLVCLLLLKVASQRQFIQLVGYTKYCLTRTHRVSYFFRTCAF